MGEMPYETVKKPKEPFKIVDKVVDNNVIEERVVENIEKNNNPVSIPTQRTYSQEEVDNIVMQRTPVPRTYSQAEVDNLLAERKGSRNSHGGKSDGRSDEDDDGEFGVSSKLLKQLQSTVGVFNALKDFASNPLTRSIETKIGERAAGIVDQAFGAPQHSGGKRDLVDTVLNSQMAFGFGQGLGARAPEFVETLGKTFGKERIDKFADNMLGQYESRSRAGGGSGSGGVGGGVGGGGVGGVGSGVGAGSGGNNEKSNSELLLSLDPNNPEHVAAYAESQGGIRPQVARKMMMIHQDELIEQMRLQGLDVSGFERGRSATEGVGSVVNNESEQLLRIRQENQEMARIKQQLDMQLEQIIREKEGKVVSFKDVKSNEEIVEEVAEIPDRWSKDDLNNTELESVIKAENTRLPKIQENKVDKTEIVNKTNKTEIVDMADTFDEIVGNINEVEKEEMVKVEKETEKEVVEMSEVHKKAPASIIDETDETTKKTVKEVKVKYPKGTQGWLKEQKEKKIAMQKEGL